jgi:hypothetical protein
MLSLTKVVAFSTLLTWIPLPFLFVELVPYTRPREKTESSARATAPPPPPATVEGDLDAMTAALTSCAQAMHAVPDNLEQCPEAKTQIDAANAARGNAVYVFATPKLTAWTPTYGNAYGVRRIVCNADRCTSERAAR